MEQTLPRNKIARNKSSYSDTGVTADNTYTYRVRAYNVTGNSGYSTTGYVITATVVPNTPSDFQSFVSTSTPPDVGLYITQTGTNEDGFTIERSTDNVNFSSHWYCTSCTIFEPIL